MTENRTPVVDQIFGANKAPAEEVLAADFADLIAEVDAACEAAEGKAKTPKDDDGQTDLGKSIIGLRALTKKIEETRTTEGKPVLDAQRAINGFFGDLKAKIDAKQKNLQGHADEYARQKAAEARAKAAREAEELRKKAEKEAAKAETAKTPQTAGSAEGRAESLKAQADRKEQEASGSAANLTRHRAAGVTSSSRAAWVARIDDYPAAIQPLGMLGNFFDEAAIQKALNALVKVQKANAKWPGVAFYQDTKANFR